MIFVLFIVHVYSFDVKGGSILGYYTIQEITAMFQNISASDSSTEYSSIGLTFLGEQIPSLRLPNPGAPKVL